MIDSFLISLLSHLGSGQIQDGLCRIISLLERQLCKLADGQLLSSQSILAWSCLSNILRNCLPCLHDTGLHLFLCHLFHPQETPVSLPPGIVARIFPPIPPLKNGIRCTNWNTGGGDYASPGGGLGSWKCWYLEWKGIGMGQIRGWKVS